MKRKHMPGCTCCGCVTLCNGPPQICGVTLDTSIHTVNVSWDDTDITWRFKPVSDLPSDLASHPYFANSNWELCYLTTFPDVPDYETTRNTYTASYSGTACGAVRSGDFIQLQFQDFRNTGINRIAIHRSISTGLFKLSVLMPMQIRTAIDDSWTYFINGVPQNSIFGPVRSGSPPIAYATYTGWRLFDVTTCEDIFAEKDILANSPALLGDLDPVPLNTTFSAAANCGSGTTQGIRFTDVGFVRRSSPVNGVIYRRITNSAAPVLGVTFIECV